MAPRRTMGKGGGTGMDWRERGAIDPQALVGKPVTRGTRVSVGFVIDLQGRGWAMEQILASTTPCARRASRVIGGNLGLPWPISLVAEGRHGGNHASPSVVGPQRARSARLNLGPVRGPAPSGRTPVRPLRKTRRAFRATFARPARPRALCYPHWHPGVPAVRPGHTGRRTRVPRSGRHGVRCGSALPTRMLRE